MIEKKLEILYSAGGLDPTYKKVGNHPEFQDKDEARTWINQRVQMGALSGENIFLVQETHAVVVFSKEVQYTLQGEQGPQQDSAFLDNSFIPAPAPVQASPMPAKRNQGGRGRGAVTKYGGPF